MTARTICSRFFHIILLSFLPFFLGARRKVVRRIQNEQYLAVWVVSHDVYAYRFLFARCGLGHGYCISMECTTGLCLLLLLREKHILEGGRGRKEEEDRRGEKKRRLLYLAEAIRHKDFEAFKPGDFGNGSWTECIYLTCFQACTRCQERGGTNKSWTKFMVMSM